MSEKINWDDRLKEILEEKGYSNCLECNRLIDRGDIAWNNGSTEYGTGYCVVEIQCLKCDTEIAYLHSWYPEIEDLQDLCHVIASDLERRKDDNRST